LTLTHTKQGEPMAKKKAKKRKSAGKKKAGKKKKR
jgi:hypothetical protein